MSIYQELVDMDELIDSLSYPPIIVNDNDLSTEEAREKLRKKVITEYDSDLVTLVPRCGCGYMKVNYNVNAKCPKCGEHAKSAIEDIEPRVWFAAPEGVVGLINPMALTMLTQRFTKNKFSVIDYLIDKNYKQGVKKPDIYYKLREMGIPRGLNNFITNFDEIYKILIEHKDFKPGPKDLDALAFEKFVAENRHKFFCKHLPFFNKTLLIVESSNLGVYIDKFVLDMIDILNTVVDCCSLGFSPNVVESRIGKNLLRLRDVYEKFCKDNLSPKKGQLRQHVFGTRTNYSFRAVITTIVGPVRFNEIHIPWGVGVTVLRHHIINRLLAIGYDIDQASDVISRAVAVHNPVVAEIMDNLIAEGGRGGIGCTLQRNPSLLQGSCLRMLITKVKKHPMDNTLAIPLPIVRPLNADIDGDELNVTLALDNKLDNLLYPLEFKFNIFRMDEPLKPHEDIFLSKQLAASINNFLTIER